MAHFGWANGMQNMVFVAGRVMRNTRNPLVFSLQQTAVVEQSIPVVGAHPLSATFPDGSYISVFARLRGRTVVASDGSATVSGVYLQGLHTRFTNGQEVDPDQAQARLFRALASVPSDARIDTSITAMDIETPEEIKNFVSEPVDATPAREEVEDNTWAVKAKDNRLLRNGNHAQIAGVIGFMEFRDGGVDPSRNRVQLYVQQNGSLEEAMLVRVYGKQAALVANTYRPGHAIFVKGEVHLDVKRAENGGDLQITPYLKTYSVESAQTPHIKTKPYPEWALQLYADGNTDAGMARRMRYVKLDARAPEAPGKKPA